MKSTLTVSLPRSMQGELDAVARRAGKSRAAFVRDAVRRQLAIARFRALRARLVPLAQARGIHTDEDVFKIVS